MARVGQRILAARTDAGMTQKQLAERLNLTRSSVANMEGGRQSVDAVQAAQIARALRVGLTDLVQLSDLPPEPPVPHVAVVEPVYRVRCRTCSTEAVAPEFPTRAAAEDDRDRHVAEMLARDHREEVPDARR